MKKILARAAFLIVAFQLVGLNLVALDASPFAAWAKLGRKGKYTETPAEENYNTGLRRLKGDDYEGAVDSLLQAIYFARNGYYPQAYYWLGIAYMGKNEDAKAVGALETAAKQTVEEPTDIYLALAEVHLRNNRIEECDKAIRSIKSYDKVTRQKVQYIEGLKWDKRGDFMASEHAFRAALGDKPWKDARVWTLMGEAIMKQKTRWRDAIKCFNDLIKTDYPMTNLRLERVYHDLGVCHLGIEDHQGAIDNWQRSLDYDQTNAEVWLNLGQLLESEKHYSSSLKYFKEFVRRARPGDPRIQQVKDKITRIEMMLRPNETMPEQPAPSQYMRRQMDGRMREQNSQYQQQAQPRRTEESGF